MFFNRQKTEDEVPAMQQAPFVPPTPAPEIREEQFIDISDPNERPAPSVLKQDEPTEVLDNDAQVYSYLLNKPIDAIYAYIEKDWEKEGEQDAFKNSDIINMNEKLEIIKQGLIRRFDMVRNKYKLKILQLKANLSNLDSLGLSLPSVSVQYEINLCEEHLAKIDELHKKLNDNHPEMTTMMKSYERGFKNGVSRKVSQELINN